MSTLQIGVRHRYLEHYPSNGQRIWYLALAVIATIMLYYESYVLPSVAPLVLRSFSLPVSTYIGILLVSNVIGALSAIFGSLSDRIGRSNLIVYGLLVTALGTVGISFANSLGVFFVLIVVLGFIEGIILVATPALVRDFSPRFGRALAMGFWTVGPVGGSVLATVIFFFQAEDCIRGGRVTGVQTCALPISNCHCEERSDEAISLQPGYRTAVARRNP